MSNIRSNPCYQAVSAELERRGIPFEIDHGGRHPRVVFQVSGQRVFHAFSSTPSDKHAAQISVGELKRRIRSAEARAESRVVSP